MDTAWREWEEQVRTCTNCALSQTRHEAVCGNGNYQARVMLLGEAPGAEEDLSGRPFAGRAGAILDAFLNATGLSRAALYIGNTVKCRPVAVGRRGYKNRKPKPAEIAACQPHLLRELAQLQPALIVSLGAVPLQFLLRRAPKMADEHGRLFHHQALDVDVFPIYHPAALIYDPGKKEAYQADLDTLRELLVARKLLN